VPAFPLQPRPPPARAGASRRTRLVALALTAALLAAGCTLLRAPPPVAALPGEAPPSAPVPPPAALPTQGASIAAVAAALIGTPYHFGGADAAGFDCSGLALYAHARVGILIPRSAAEQQRAAAPVPLEQLAPGDLLFFHIRARRVDHVGIYSGDGRFVHAPRAGLAVSYAQLSGFYLEHLSGAGRFWK
jgi:murein DD-endopeptidase